MKLGKPIGSDIREGKKTLFYLYLLEEVSAEIRQRLETIFGNQEASDGDIDFVRQLIVDMRLRDRVNVIIGNYVEKAWKGLKDLNGCRTEAKSVLEGLIEYSTARTM